MIRFVSPSNIPRTDTETNVFILKLCLIFALYIICSTRQTFQHIMEKKDPGCNKLEIGGGVTLRTLNVTPIEGHCGPPIENNTISEVKWCNSEAYVGYKLDL